MSSPNTNTDEVLHITCGDCAANALRQSPVDGEILVWHDPVLEGELRIHDGDEVYRQVRAQHFVKQKYVKEYGEALAGLEARHRKLNGAGGYDEVVLWFDACLFDQSILLQVMDRLSLLELPDTRLSLLCVGDHAEIDRYLGLGQLSSEQMAALYPSRHEITAAEMTLARAAWQALTASDPRDIQRLAEGDCSPLPYLEDALHRRLEMFPSTVNGLSRLEQEILRAVAGGAHEPMAIFRAVQDMEDRPWFGDIMVWERIDAMAEDRVPLLEVNGPGPLKRPLWEQPQPVEDRHIECTDAGRDVLAGKADRIKLSGIDLWLGGVHLNGNDAHHHLPHGP